MRRPRHPGDLGKAPESKEGAIDGPHPEGVWGSAEEEEEEEAGSGVAQAVDAPGRGQRLAHRKVRREDHRSESR